jgi:thiol-disulfide isomerase/thioredoxin
MTSTGPERGSAHARRKYALLGVAAALVVSALVYGIVGGRRKETSASTDCPASTLAASAAAPFAKGQVAAMQISSGPRMFPNVDFQGPAGEPRKVSDFQGKTILLNLWATWCVPCREEMPALDKLQAQLGGPHFEVVAVDVDTARLDSRKAFLQQAGVRSLAFYADPTAQILRSLREAGPVIGLPTTFLLGADGCEVGAMLGPAVWSSTDATALIAAALRTGESKG